MTFSREDRKGSCRRAEKWIAMKLDGRSHSCAIYVCFPPQCFWNSLEESKTEVRLDDKHHLFVLDLSEEITPIGHWVGQS